MKRLIEALLTATLMAGVTANAQAPEIRFDSVPNALQLPAGLYLGEVGGVATNSRGDRDGEIYRMSLDGTMTGRFGRAGKLPKEFGTVNAIDCRTENTLYVGEIGNLRVQKLALH